MAVERYDQPGPGQSWTKLTRGESENAISKADLPKFYCLEWATLRA